MGAIHIQYVYMVLLLTCLLLMTLIVRIKYPMIQLFPSFKERVLDSYVVNETGREIRLV